MSDARRVLQRLAVLSPKPGDFLLVSGPYEACRAVMDLLGSAPWKRPEGWPADVPLPIIPLFGARLETADERMMNAAGWYRRPAAEESSGGT